MDAEQMSAEELDRHIEDLMRRRRELRIEQRKVALLRDRKREEQEGQQRPVVTVVQPQGIESQARFGRLGARIRDWLSR